MSDSKPLATIPLTLVVLTFNEETNLRRCLESVRNLVSEIFVVDSGSKDATVEIAKTAGSTVVDHPFLNHAAQWDWALSSLPISNDWVLGLDADQRLTPELAVEIRQLFLNEPGRLDENDGFYINRKQIFRGRWIRHGGYYPKYLLKMFRHQGVALDKTEQLDHHFCVNRATALRHDLIEENKKEDTIAFWLQKHLRYAELLANEAIAGDRQRMRPRLSDLRDPARRVIALKGVWATLPHYWRAFGFFGYRYFIRLGLLDGREGLIFHFLQTCWFRLIVDLMIEEQQNNATTETSSR